MNRIELKCNYTAIQMFDKIALVVLIGLKCNCAALHMRIK